MSDQIIREITLIRRYSRHNEAEDVRFRTLIKTRLNLSNGELDAVVQETTDAVWSQIDCTTCANCCKTLQIELSHSDIDKLATRLQMPSREFTKRYITVLEDKARVFRTQPCPFLGEDNRCTVYEDRPQSCRGYPFLHKEDFRQRTLMYMENIEICPIIFNVWQRLKERFGSSVRERPQKR